MFFGFCGWEKSTTTSNDRTSYYDMITQKNNFLFFWLFSLLIFSSSLFTFQPAALSIADLKRISISATLEIFTCKKPTLPLSLFLLFLFSFYRIDHCTVYRITGISFGATASQHILAPLRRAKHTNNQFRLSVSLSHKTSNYAITPLKRNFTFFYSPARKKNRR